MLTFRVKVDNARCTGVGECELACPVDVFDIIKDKAYPTREEFCIGCEACMEVCPNDAIKVWFPRQ
jgi:NAD-dependent dihydropyrimidine dehydrogenase PreA subunit